MRFRLMMTGGRPSGKSKAMTGRVQVGSKSLSCYSGADRRQAPRDRAVERPSDARGDV
jgi:hypothetical protein